MDEEMPTTCNDPFDVVRRKLGETHATLLEAVEAATVIGSSELIPHVADAMVAVDRAREDL